MLSTQPSSSVFPGIRETRKLVHLSVHDLPVAKALTDKESVLSTFKNVFDCLSSLKFLDVGWIKDAETVTGWDVACVILERRGSGLTHLDVSGLTTLCETLRFVKDLGIERSLQYLGALHTNIRYPIVFDDDADIGLNRKLSNDLAVDVDELKIVATGFQNTDALVLCQSHYVAPTPRNDAILKLIAGRMMEDGDRNTDVLPSFVLRKCRAARRSKWDASSCFILGRLALYAAFCCEREAVLHGIEYNCNFYSILHELILSASSSSSVSSAVKLTEIIHSQYVFSEYVEVHLELHQLLLVIAFCHLKSNSADLEESSSRIGRLIGRLLRDFDDFPNACYE